MGNLFWNLVLAFAWAALYGEITAFQIFIGFVLGFVALKVTRGASEGDHYHARVLNLLRLMGFLLFDLIRSNFKLAYDVMTPRARSSPGIVAYPLEARTDAEITLLVMVLSYIPGMQVVELSEDRRSLFVHGVFVVDRDLFCEHIRATIERPLLEVLR